MLLIKIFLGLFFLYASGYTIITIISLMSSLINTYNNKQYLSAIENSNFKIKYPGVSVLIPAYNEEMTIKRTLESLRHVIYPEFEIIVVNDGSKDNTLKVLIETYHLKPVHKYIKPYLQTQPLRAGIFEGKINDIKLIVIDKENGGKSDALNTGINASKYDLFLTLDADSMVQKDSIIRIVTPYLKHDNVIAIGGDVKISNGVKFKKGKVKQFTVPNNLLVDFQIIEYFRSFLTTRVWFNKFNGNLIISGAFGLFKKSAVISVGGYSRGTIGEDMDLVVKLHSYNLKNNNAYRIEYANNAVCWTQAPFQIKDLKSQRIRWHTGLVQTLTSHSYIFFNPKYKIVSMFSFLYYFLYEMISPLIIIAALIFLVVLWQHHIVNLSFMLFFILSYAIYTTINSWASIYLEQYFFKYKISKKDIFKLIFLSIFEGLGYRQMNMFFKLIAIFRSGKKNQSWGTIKRAG